jgi:hypothetical protein
MGKEKKTSPAYPVNKYSGIAILEHDNYGISKRLYVASRIIGVLYDSVYKEDLCRMALEMADELIRLDDETR